MWSFPSPALLLEIRDYLLSFSDLGIFVPPTLCLFYIANAIFLISGLIMQFFLAFVTIVLPATCWLRQLFPCQQGPCSVHVLQYVSQISWAHGFIRFVQLSSCFVQLNAIPLFSIRTTNWLTAHLQDFDCHLPLIFPIVFCYPGRRGSIFRHFVDIEILYLYGPLDVLMGIVTMYVEAYVCDYLLYWASHRTCTKEGPVWEPNRTSISDNANGIMHESSELSCSYYLLQICSNLAFVECTFSATQSGTAADIIEVFAFPISQTTLFSFQVFLHLEVFHNHSFLVVVSCFSFPDLALNLSLFLYGGLWLLELLVRGAPQHFIACMLLWGLVQYSDLLLSRHGPCLLISMIAIFHALYFIFDFFIGIHTLYVNFWSPVLHREISYGALHLSHMFMELLLSLHLFPLCSACVVIGIFSPQQFLQGGH